MTPDRATSPRQSLLPGTEVEVRTQFEGRWTRGFAVQHGDDDRGYVLQRLGDGTVLPARFAVHELMRGRKRFQEEK